MLNTPGDCVQRLSVFIPELITWKSKIKLIFKTPPPQKKKQNKTKQNKTKQNKTKQNKKSNHKKQQQQ